MLAYASDRRRFAQRHSAPQAMLLIIAVHVAMVALVMSARMDVAGILDPVETETYNVPLPKDPPPPAPPQPRASPATSTVDTVPPLVPAPKPEPLPFDPVPLPQPSRQAIGPGLDRQPQPLPIPRPATAPLRVGPRFATPGSQLKPPYPAAKLAREEEASLTLRLAIDERGRVVAVDPVGRADPAFLDAARRHLIARWRYQPATEDGRPVASTTVITLRFELDG